MTAEEIRRKYLSFFKASPRNHKEIAFSPLVLKDDPTTLFTSSGMQPLVPYLIGKPHRQGKRLVNSQPCFRAVDIEEIGDMQHTTFFEMLGNWSLGDYFKEQQLAWFLEFLTKELGLSKDRLWVSIFDGDKDFKVLEKSKSQPLKPDVESKSIWTRLGIPEKRIRLYGVKENWWSISGTPKQMSVGDIGGPDSEVFYDLGEDLRIHKSSPFKDRDCHPNCRCGRFLETGNSVFIQYKKIDDRTFELLPNKNVDFGGGLERLTAAVNNDPDVFQIDTYKPVIKSIEKELQVSYGESKDNDRSIRIIADHLRAASMIIAAGVAPSNKLQGYALRRLIRRTIFHSYLLEKQELTGASLTLMAQGLKGSHPEVSRNWLKISTTLGQEADRFSDALDRGLRKLRKTLKERERIDGKFAFDLYQTDGFPLDLTLEILGKKGKKFSKKEKGRFEKEFDKHRELSRTASAGMFKGGLADASEETKKLHTATHLLHAALRKILGDHVEQKGSNITTERLRFDFSHPQKLTDKEVKKVEHLINEQIKRDLPVTFEAKTLKEALDEGALAFFGERYGQKVKVYTIGNPSASSGPPFSREVCGGPHVTTTREIGRVRIRKQEKIGAGLTRIYAVVVSKN